MECNPYGVFCTRYECLGKMEYNPGVFVLGLSVLGRKHNPTMVCLY